MSLADCALEPVAPEPEQALRDPNVAREARQFGRWPTGEPFPKLMTAGDLMKVFDIGHSRFAVLKNLGRFRFLEVHPRIGRAVYSGTKLEQYCAGESFLSFGRKRA